MPKKDGVTGEAIVSESGNWNVASDFARVKIMIPQAKCEYYEDIATFGYDSIVEELMGYSIPNDLIRYTGLNRLINELIKLCKNSKFAMKKGKTKEELEGYEKQLKKIKNTLHFSISIKKNNIKKTQNLIIKEEIFGRILEIVLEIKSSINTPLNKNHLIFTDKEEFDPAAFKELAKKRMIEHG